MTGPVGWKLSHFQNLKIRAQASESEVREPRNLSRCRQGMSAGFPNGKFNGQFILNDRIYVIKKFFLEPMHSQKYHLEPIYYTVNKLFAIIIRFRFKIQQTLRHRPLTQTK